MRPFFPTTRRSPRRRPPPSSPRRNGFTLVELLVSMTVLVVLFGLLLGVFNAASSGWQQGESRVDAYREARAALALMARDLGATMIPPLPTPHSPTGPVPALAPALVLDRHPDDGPVSADDPNEQAHCLSLVPNTGKSALCAVSYFCRWDDSKKTWNLARRLVNSDTLFNRFKDARGQVPTPFLAIFARSQLASAEDDIASYVWDLQFRVPGKPGNLDRTANAQPAPSSNGGKYAVTPPFADQLPPYIEIRFKALSAVAGARLRGSATQETWMRKNPNDPLYRSVILPGAQQFVQRVPLANAALP